MPVIRCNDINAVHWAYVAEYARRRRVDRCKGLEMIIEEHMRFSYKFTGVANVSEKTKVKKKK